jgi:hypothetical protein
MTYPQAEVTEKLYELYAEHHVPNERFFEALDRAFPGIEVAEMLQALGEMKARSEVFFWLVQAGVEAHPAWDRGGGGGIFFENSVGEDHRATAAEQHELVAWFRLEHTREAAEIEDNVRRGSIDALDCLAESGGGERRRASGEARR